MQKQKKQINIIIYYIIYFQAFNVGMCVELLWDYGMKFCITTLNTRQAIMIIVNQIKETTYNFYIHNTS